MIFLAIVQTSPRRASTFQRCEPVGLSIFEQDATDAFRLNHDDVLFRQAGDKQTRAARLFPENVPGQKVETDQLVGVQRRQHDSPIRAQHATFLPAIAAFNQTHVDADRNAHRDSRRLDRLRHATVVSVRPDETPHLRIERRDQSRRSGTKEQSFRQRG